MALKTNCSAKDIICYIETQPNMEKKSENVTVQINIGLHKM